MPAAVPPPPAPAMPKVMAMITQPHVSSMIAVATMIWPRLRRMKFISRTTIATILIEEMDSAVPRNSDGTSRLPPPAAEQRRGTELAQQKAAGEGKGDAAQRDRHRREAGFAHQLEIGLHAGQQQQHQDADLRQPVDHAFLRRIGRER